RRLEHARERLRISLRDLMRSEEHRLAQAETRLHSRRPDAMRARLAERLDGCAIRLQRGAARIVDKSTALVTARGARREAVSPKSVLGRGYSVTLAANGRAVRSPTDVSEGEAITSMLAHGSIASTVGKPARPRARLKTARASTGPSGPDLFELLRAVDPER